MVVLSSLTSALYSPPSLRLFHVVVFIVRRVKIIHCWDADIVRIFVIDVVVQLITQSIRIVV